MFKIRLVLALLMLAGSLTANAQHNGRGDRGDRGDRNDGVSGGICEIGRDCHPGLPGGGGAPVDPSPYDPRPDRPGRPDPRPPGGGWQEPDYNYGDRREIYVGRRVQNEHMDLLRLAGLDAWSDRGSEIESVEVVAQPGAVSSSLSLNADGYVVASSNWPSTYNTLTPNRRLTIGSNLNQLSLGVRGVLHIDRIVIHLRSSGGWNPPPQQPPYGDAVASGYVGQSFYYNDVIDLEQVTNLYQYRGYRITSVTIRGRQLDSRGSARVLVNGQTAGRINLTSGRDTVSMPIHAVVGQNLSSLQLQIVPSLQIDSVEVTLSRY